MLYGLCLWFFVQLDFCLENTAKKKFWKNEFEFDDTNNKIKNNRLIDKFSITLYNKHVIFIVDNQFFSHRTVFTNLFRTD